MNWLSPITSVIDSVAGIFKAKEERKNIAEQAKATLNQSIQNGQHQVTISDAQWEAISAQMQADSWKDEYVTILITTPLAMMLIGSVTTVFFNDDRLVKAGIASIEAFTAAGVDMGFMMQAVVLAALGLKIWRKA